MTALLSEELLSTIGRQSEPRREIVTRRDIRKYAVATGNRQRKYLYPSTACCQSSPSRKRWPAASRLNT